MNFNLQTLNQSTQFLQNKLNQQNNHFMNQQQQQQQQLASRFIGLNANQFIPNSSNNLTSSPPLSGQFSNAGLSLSLGQQQQQQQQQMQQNFPMVSPNMMFQNNPINHLNFSNNNPLAQQK